MTVARVELDDVVPDVFMDGAYRLTECADEGLQFDVQIGNGVEKGPGQSCTILVRTQDGSAIGECVKLLSRTTSLNSLSLASWQ